MMNWLVEIFTGTHFLPHRFCIAGSDALLIVAASSNLLIFIAYFSIPLTLGYFTYCRKELVSIRFALWLFALFILSCGTTHLLHVITYWQPWYWLQATLDTLTAIISVYTAIYLWPLLPKLLNLPGHEQLLAFNQQLQFEINEREAVEEMLRQEIAFSKTLISSLPGLFYRLDEQAHLLGWNDVLASLLGAEGLKSAQINVLSIIADEDKASVADAIARGIANGYADVQARLKLVNGESRCFYFIGKTLMVGDQLHLLGTGVDVSAQNQALQQLRESETRLNALFENMHSGVAIYRASEDGENFFFVDFNRAAEQFDKQQREKLIGKNVVDVFPGVVEMGLLAVFKRVWQTGVAEQFPLSFYADNRIAGWRENYVYKLPSGEIVTIYEDVTERKQTEIALRASEQKLRLLIEQIPLALGLASNTGELLYLNDRFKRTFGYTLDDVPTLEQWYLQAYPEDNYRQQAIARWTASVEQAAIQNADIEPAEYRITCKNGEVRVMMISGLFFDNSLLAMFVDITERKKLEEQLRNISLYTRNLIEVSLDPLVTISVNGKITDVNKATETVTGFAREQLINSDFAQYFTDPSQASVGYLEAFSKGSITDYPLVIKHRNGHLTNVLYNAVVYKNENGEIAGVFAAARDITERKQVEERLRESESRFRTIIENEPECIKIVDANGRLKQMNPAGLAMIEADSLEQVAGGMVLNLIAPEYRLAFADLHKRVIAGETMQLEYEVLGLKGGRRWLETHAVPMQEHGKVVHLAVTRDITQRKQAEQQLRELNRDFVTFLENTSDFIYFKDQNSRIRFCSQTLAKITQHKSWHDLVGKHDFEIFPAETAQIYYEEELPIFAQGLPLLNKVDPYYAEDGTKSWISTSKWPVFDFDNRKVIGIFGISRDITQLKQTEQELLRSNANLEQFAYSVSHDMRQPLRSVTGHLQLLARSLKDKLDEDERINLNFALEGAKRMDAMILSLLDYSRVGRKTETKAWISSRAVLDEALEFLALAIQDAKAELKITGDWGQVFVSHDELSRLLMNLISNAIKYRDANQSPCVEIDSIVMAGTWKVSVRDYGIGIDPQQIDRLFLFFSRLQSRTRFEGTGMGLALCKRIVEHHGGRIWVESAGEGQGSCFMFELPLLQPENAEIAQ